MKTKLIFIAGLLFVNSLALAAEEPLQVRSFLNITGVGSDSDYNPMDGAEREFGLTKLSKAGILLSKRMDANWDASILLLSKGYSRTPFSLNVEWAQMLWNPSDSLQVRVGKQVMAAFLISDYYEIGGAYPWIQPPVPVYSLNPFRSVQGVTAHLPFETLGGKAEASVTYGTMTTNIFSNAVELRADSTVPVGFISAKWTKDELTIKAATSQARNAKLTTITPAIDAGALNAQLAGYKIEIRKESNFGDCSFSSVGFQYDSDYVMYGEVANTLCPTSSEMKVIEGQYITFGKHFSDRAYLAHATYASSGKTEGTLVAGQAYSTAVGLNRTINTSTMLKFEATANYYPDGTNLRFSGGTAMTEGKRKITTTAVSLVAEF